MGNSINTPDDYRIEISGWGLDSNFFVERTDLFWTPSGEKKVQLHRVLSEGAIVFVRLLSSECANNSVPVPYRIEGVEPMDCNGRCHVTLKQLRGRSKESLTEKDASKDPEESAKVIADGEDKSELQREEILQ